MQQLIQVFIFFYIEIQLLCLPFLFRWWSSFASEDDDEDAFLTRLLYLFLFRSPIDSCPESFLEGPSSSEDEQHEDPEDDDEEDPVEESEATPVS